MRSQSEALRTRERGRESLWLCVLVVVLPALAQEPLPPGAGDRTVFGAVAARQDPSPALAAGTTTAWHQPYVPGDGYWRRRIPLDFTNPRPTALTDEPVTLTIGAAAAMLPLVGAAVREVRVCSADGVEYLFAVEDRQGRPLTEGLLEEGHRLVIPVECGARQTRRYLIYAGNPDAWQVPDLLELRGQLLNPGFENGSGAEPEGWLRRGQDERHTIAWAQGGAHAGDRCMQMRAMPGSAPTWFTATQTRLRVEPGRRYALRGWVKGREITGQAGLYLHVSDGTNPQALNRVEGAGEGTFDWREVTLAFTAPPGARTADVGSVLHGTGEAWYDDVTLDGEAPPPAEAVRIEVLPEQRLDLQREAAPDAWPGEPTGLTYRIPLTVRNLEDRPFVGVVLADGQRLRGRLAATEALAVRAPGGEAGTWQPCVSLAGTLALRVSLPPRSEIGCLAYVVPAGSPPSPAAGESVGYRDLLDGASGNLLRNPGMEAGDGTPEAWTTGTETRPGAGLASGIPGEPDVTYARTSPGFASARCLRLSVGPTAPKAWRGWRQAVEVKPDTTYLYAAWIRTDGVAEGEVRLHCHTLDAEGRLCGPRYQSVGPATGSGLTGRNDWSLLLGTVRTSADTRTAVVYLTMDARGTVEHDAVLFCEVRQGTWGPAQTRPDSLDRDLTLWQVNPVVKVFPDQRPGPRLEHLTASAARNEREGVQVAMLSRSDLGAVTVSVVPPSHPSGYRLPEVRIERVGYVPVDHVSAFFTAEALSPRRVLPEGSPIADGWAGWWPDPLLPVHAPLALTAGRVQPLWLTFAVPKDAPAGAYRGELVLSTREGRTVVPIQLIVWDFELPDRPRLTALFDLREGPGWQYLTPDHRRDWLRFMAERRLCTDQILPAPGMRLEDGQVRLDTAEFDQAASWCFDELHLRTAYLPLEFYAFGWGHDTRPFRGLAPDTAAYADAYGRCLAAVWDHVRARGWADRFVLYLSDEPHFDDRDPAVAARVIAQMKRQCALAHAAAPGVKVYSSTWRHTAEWDDALDIWGAGAFGCFPVATMERLRAAGRRLWFTTDAQLLLDTPYSAIERLNPYYCFVYGAEGYEFWALGWWTYPAYDPFRFGWYAYIPHTFTTGGPTQMIRYPNGSGHLSYPGWLVGEPGPLSSVRLEQVREGMEDYEYMATLRERLAAARARGDDPAAAAGLLERIRGLVPIPNAGGTRSTAILPDPDAVYRLRADLATAIQQTPP